MSHSSTNILIQYICNGAHNSLALTSFLGYHKGHVGMKNNSMLPIQGTKTYFLTARGTWHIQHLAGVMSMDCSSTPKVQKRSYFSIFANQIMPFQTLPYLCLSVICTTLGHARSSWDYSKIRKRPLLLATYGHHHYSICHVALILPICTSHKITSPSQRHCGSQAVVLNSDPFKALTFPVCSWEYF